MMRRLGAASTVLTVLVGLLVLPHTHLHPSASAVDAHRAHRAPLVHAHVTPHDHEGEPADESTDDERGAQQIRSIDAFVFQPAAKPANPTPVLVATPLFRLDIPKTTARIVAAHPPAHGPPTHRPTSLRAPPLASLAFF